MSGSLIPPRRKPLAAWTLRLTVSEAAKRAMIRGARPLASVDPGTETSDVPLSSLPKMPSKICWRSSWKL